MSKKAIRMNKTGAHAERGPMPKGSTWKVPKQVPLAEAEQLVEVEAADWVDPREPEPAPSVEEVAAVEPEGEAAAEPAPKRRRRVRRVKR